VAVDSGGPDQTLERSLRRVSEALARSGPRQLAPAQPRPLPTWTPGAVLAGASVVCVAVVAATGVGILVPVAACLGIGGALLLARGFARPPPPDAPPHIGMGATIAADAIVEPGAVVEMGATVRSGAAIRAGARVGMGSTVGARAVIERGAVVSWGATVRSDAVVGAGSVVGWGATVGKGVRVPPRMRLRAGSTVSSGWLRELFGGPPAQLPAGERPDPARERVTAVCDRLAEEFRRAPEHVRSFLGASEATIASLRSTCEDLLQRERALRAEVDPQALARLDEERRRLEARIAAEPDELIRGSLQGAVAAIDAQRRQRELLQLGADRLQAEQTRLLYTLEGLATQFVRLRSAGTDAARPPTVELERGVAQLGSEIDAIAEALEQVARDAPVPAQRVRGG
jgi:carbonic anhydrase/acetyltransferase-like protein (isoleucine patch superfamily)